MARKRGRPSVDPQGLTMRVDLTLSAATYDALYAAARRSEVSVPELIRRQLRARRRPQGDDDDREE